MTTYSEKKEAIKESIRDIDREVLNIERKMENLEGMTNPAESQKQFKEIIEELKARKEVLQKIGEDLDVVDLFRNMIIPSEFVKEETKIKKTDDAGEKKK